MAAENWTEFENNAIVADYFAMLADDLAMRPYNKAAHNRGLQRLIGRNRGSIEWKHRNISAILRGMGEPEIAGYKPAFNIQTPLIDAVFRHLTYTSSRRISTKLEIEINAMQDASKLWIGPPPTQRNTPPPDELEQMLSIARKFDVAKRDERNRKLGEAGEELIYRREKSHLENLNRADLADRVRWVSKEDGDGAGYDIASFHPNGDTRLLEVKTTKGWDRTPFHISRNELKVAESRRDEWSLLRVWDFQREPKAFEIHPPLDAHVTLTPTSFKASFY